MNLISSVIFVTFPLLCFILFVEKSSCSWIIRYIVRQGVEGVTLIITLFLQYKLCKNIKCDYHDTYFDYIRNILTTP